MRPHLLVPTLCLGLASSATHAQPAEPATLVEAPPEAQAEQFFRVALNWENDGAVALKPWHATDRHYTNCFGGTLTWQPDFASHLLDAVLPDSDGAAFGVGFGHEIHTPANLLADPPADDDRPYAGYLYGSAFLQREICGELFDQPVAHYDLFRLNLGVVGPSSQAQAIQTSIHDAFTGDDPQGWDSQLGDEFTAQLQYIRKLRVDVGGFDWGDTRFDGQLVPSATLNLGTVRRDLGASVMYRLGVNLPDDFGPDQLRDVQSLTGDPLGYAKASGHPLGEDWGAGRGVWSVYGFGRVGGKYVEWSTFLDGNYARDPSPSVEKKPWVGELEAGLVVGYARGPHSFELGYATTWLTDQFDGQTGRDSYASVNLRWAFAF
ncbi:MAG: lipid A deacylase LpxR family protein [Planctomycetota bacterium]